MVKVIETKTFKTSCYKCKCTLEFTYHDVKEMIDVDYGGGRERVDYIICPICDSKVIVKI